MSPAEKVAVAGLAAYLVATGWNSFHAVRYAINRLRKGMLPLSM